MCPYCSSGFVEQLEAEAEHTAPTRDDVSDADMSTLDDSDETTQVCILEMFTYYFVVVHIVGDWYLPLIILISGAIPQFLLSYK